MPDAQLLHEPLLDANEAARLLRVPRSTLYELVRSRGLPHVRIGERGLRFTRSDLEVWIAEHTYGTRRRA
jgi:excisionase family DNA binding protein